MNLEELNLDRNLYKIEETIDTDGATSSSSSITPVPTTTVQSGASANDINTSSKGVIADRIDSGLISSKKITLGVIPQGGDVWLAAGKTDFTNSQTGFILGVQDVAGGIAKFYIGNAANYLNWDGTSLIISGSITATTGTIGGFTITGTALSAGAGATRIQLDTTQGIFLGANSLASAPFSVSLAGVLTATSGTVGGWEMTSTLLRSDSSGARVELDKAKKRISIFDVSADTVVMGYLDGLPKHDGSGNWGPSNYGFWARPGDKLSIDGDSEYVSGDWIVQNDASYLINDGANRTIIRLGSDTGEKGLFIYNTSGVKLAKYISTGIYIGDNTNFLSYDTTNGLIIQGQFNIGGTTITIDNTTNIQTTLNTIEAEGGGTLFLQPGTYTLTSNIYIPSGSTLAGVAIDSVILDCNSLYSVYALGTNVYTTGTASIIDNSPTVTGLGTTWTAAMIGRYIWLDYFWYEIIAVGSVTELTLRTNYQGTNLSGVNYVISSISQSSKIQGLTIKNSPGSGFIGQYTQELKVDNILVQNCVTGIELQYSKYSSIQGYTDRNVTGMLFNQSAGLYLNFSESNDNTGAGIVLTNIENSSVINSTFDRNTLNGMTLTNVSDTAFVANSVRFNQVNGIQLVSDVSNCQFSETSISGNNVDGILISASSDRNTVVACAITNNGGYGVNII